MIRGPVLPHMRAGLWTLVASHLDAIETGLVLVLEELDSSGGHLGVVEGLARDASGAPVLLLLAIDGDALLAARALSALEFLGRVGDSLATAIPEANFAAGVVGRVVVVGTDAAAASLEFLRRLPLSGLELCRLEPFRVAGTERFAVRWLTSSGGAGGTLGTPALALQGTALQDSSLVTRGAANPGRVANAPVEFAVPSRQAEHWQSIVRLCERLDPGVSIDGDRFWRRITWHGRLLGHVTAANGGLHTSGPDGVGRSLLSAADVREFGDLLVRRYAVLAGLAGTDASVPSIADARRSREEVLPGAGGTRGAARHAAGDTLRATLAGVRLTPEEYSALGGPARVAGGGTEVAGVADDVVRIVAAQEGSWAGPTMRTD